MAAVISCAGDNELAKRLYSHMISEFSPTSTDFISLNEDEVTLQNKKLSVKNNAIRESLGKFVGSSSDLVGYSIAEFGDIFTVGIQQSLDKVVIACEMCGYVARHESDLTFTRERMGSCPFPNRSFSNSG